MGRALRGDDRGAADAGVGCPGRESARRLLDAGLLRVWIRDLAQDNVYSLAPRGARLLRDDRGDTAEESWVTPRGLDGNLDHLLAINQVRIELALSVPSVKGEIAWWRS